jgi:hypothetical protein
VRPRLGPQLKRDPLRRSQRRCGASIPHRHAYLGTRCDGAPCGTCASRRPAQPAASQRRRSAVHSRPGNTCQASSAACRSTSRAHAPATPPFRRASQPAARTAVACGAGGAAAAGQAATRCGASAHDAPGAPTTPRCPAEAARIRSVRRAMAAVHDNLSRKALR